MSPVCSWVGLGLSLATVFLFTEGMKNLFGKPRPDLLSRCDADLTKIVTSTVGGVGNRVSQGIVLVSSAICRQRDSQVLNDGFKSFPSGHASCKAYIVIFAFRTGC
jgi:membrane-associated phospholipid phosphatase